MQNGPNLPSSSPILTLLLMVVMGAMLIASSKWFLVDVPAEKELDSESKKRVGCSAGSASSHKSFAGRCTAPTSSSETARENIPPTVSANLIQADSEPNPAHEGPVSPQTAPTR